MTLLIDHGLRVDELADLQITAVNLVSGQLRFYRPKVDKTQTHKLTKAALVAYLPVALALGPLLRDGLKGGELAGPMLAHYAHCVRVWSK